MSDIEKQFQDIITSCEIIFLNKITDYGFSWRILRPKSLTDQIFIKANRIRTIEEKKISKIDDPIDFEYIGIINYSVMSIIQLKNPDIDNKSIIETYRNILNVSTQLMLNKNHDYDGVWKQMRISSLTDIILQKLLRIKQIEDNDGVTKISEGLEFNFYDIINYSIFALIKLKMSDDKNPPNPPKPTHSPSQLIKEKN